MNKPSYADVLKNNKSLTKEKDYKNNMERLTNFSNELKNHTTEELWLLAIRKIQNIILTYFESNVLLLTENSNKISYPEDSDLMKLIEKATSYADFYITRFSLYSKLSKQNYTDKDANKYISMFNDPLFLKELTNKFSKHDKNFKNLKVRVDMYSYMDNDDEERLFTGLRFTLSLLDNYDYTGFLNNCNSSSNTGNSSGKLNLIISNLLRARDEEKYRKEQESLMKKYYDRETLSNQELFSNALSLISAKQEILNDKSCSNDDDPFYYLNLYEVYAFLKLLNAFSKYTIIKYELCSDYLKFHNNSSYNFTENESLQLNKVLGYDKNIFNFELTSYKINIRFDKSSIDNINVPIDIMEKCRKLLDCNRIKIRKELLYLINKNKEEIIQECLRLMKVEKELKIQVKKVDLYPLNIECKEEQFNENLITPLIQDKYIVTPEFEKQVNDILGLSGFKIFADESSDCFHYNNETILNINSNIAYIRLFMEIPDCLSPIL